MNREQMIDMFLISNMDKFPTMSQQIVRDKLMSLNESQLMNIHAVDFKSPTMVLIVSIFVGYLGIDRFIIGDVGMGLLKLLTGGLCGILSIIDWFTISGKTKEKNLATLLSIY